MVKKTITDFTIKSSTRLSETYALLKLTPADGSEVTPAMPGQFVQVAVPDAPHTFLRRPISVNFIDRSDNTLWLLVRNAGEGTSRLCSLKAGEHLNIILPLGNGFSIPEAEGDFRRLLLVGGGVGVAPLLFLSQRAGANRNFCSEHAAVPICSNSMSLNASERYTFRPMTVRPEFMG